MSSYATIETVVLPDVSRSLPASGVTPDIWGKVYQNYISTNLSSEQLAKGAYDAYNLLTTNNLYNFSTQTSGAILSLSKSVNSIDSALQTNFDTLHTFKTNISVYFNSVFYNPMTGQDSTSARNPLLIPTRDDGTQKYVYDLATSYTLPIVTANKSNDYYSPGLLKGEDYHKFSLASGCFMNHDYTDSDLYGWTQDYNTLLGNNAFFRPRTNSSKMEILAFKVNSLQAQVAELKQVLIKLLAGTDEHVAINHLRVKQISFVDTADYQVDFSKFDEHYMKQDLFTTIQ